MMISAEEARERTFLYRPTQEVDDIAHDILEELSERVLEKANDGEFEAVFEKELRFPRDIVVLSKGDANYIAKKINDILKIQGYQVFWCRVDKIKNDDEFGRIAVDIDITWEKNEE